jgi:hypothetical protein
MYEGHALTVKGGVLGEVTGASYDCQNLLPLLILGHFQLSNLREVPRAVSPSAPPAFQHRRLWPVERL